MKGKRTIEQSMFYGAKPDIFQKAAELRANETGAERKLWQYLKGNKFEGYKFRRQHPIDIFIVDFYCHKARLVIEIDGGIHKLAEVKEHDEGREFELKELGLSIMRFTNTEVEKNIMEVLKKIRLNLDEARAGSLQGCKGAGRKIMEKQMKYSTGVEQVDVSGLSIGLYLIVIGNSYRQQISIMHE
ncbi:MAG: DUF559 domain-containing protein [Bacteroidota bacterium]